MTTRLHVAVIGFAVVLSPTCVSAQYSAVVSPPVDHPVSIPPATLTRSAWTHATGEWGEALATSLYRDRGFQRVESIKRLGGQGIDHVALKYGPSGSLVDVRFGETKTHFGGKARLSSTKLGPQLSKEWLVDKFRAMQNSGDPKLRKMIHDIHRFRRDQGLSIASFVRQHAEFHDLDTKRRTYVRRNAASGAVLSHESIANSLDRVKAHGSTRVERKWASRCLARLGEIGSTSMELALARRSIARSSILRRSTQSGLRGAARRVTSRALGRVVRAAGPIGVAVAVAFDAHEVYTHYNAYQRGKVSRRQFVVGIARSGGGVVAAGAGAAVGAWVGTFGGPAAWVTVPAGMTIGGIVGYVAGSTTGGAIAQGWYSTIDDAVKHEVDRWIVEHSFGKATAAR